MGFDHHRGEVLELVVGLELLRLGLGFRRERDAVGPVDFLGDPLDSLAQRRVQIVEELEVDRIVAGVDHRVGKLQRPFAAVLPMLGYGHPGAGLFGDLPRQVDLGLGVVMEGVDGHHGIDPGLLDGIDVLNQVAHAVFQPGQVLLEVFLRKRLARRARKRPGVHSMRLQGPNGRGDYRDVGHVARVPALHVPELLEPDIGPEARFGNVVVGQLQTDLVGHDRRLAHRDIGERPGVHQARLPFQRLEQIRVHRLAEPRGHGPGHVEVFGGDGLAPLVVGHDDPTHPLAEIFQIAEDGQDGHHFR